MPETVSQLLDDVEEGGSPEAADGAEGDTEQAKLA